MQLIINNLGPIKQGEIDLAKNFYVFVGYNNSGKTYMSHLFWTLFNENTIGKFAKSVKVAHFEGDSERRVGRAIAKPTFFCIVHHKSNPI